MSAQIAVLVSTRAAAVLLCFRQVTAWHVPLHRSSNPLSLHSNHTDFGATAVDGQRLGITYFPRVLMYVTVTPG